MFNLKTFWKKSDEHFCESRIEFKITTVNFNWLIFTNKTSWNHLESLMSPDQLTSDINSETYLDLLVFLDSFIPAKIKWIEILPQIVQYSTRKFTSITFFSFWHSSKLTWRAKASSFVITDDTLPVVLLKSIENVAAIVTSRINSYYYYRPMPYIYNIRQPKKVELIDIYVCRIS